MFYNPLTITEPAEAPSFAYPSINEELSLIWDGLDGHIIGPIHATAADVQILDPVRNQFRQLGTISDVRIDCYVTEARMAMVCPKYDKGGGWVGEQGPLCSMPAVRSLPRTGDAGKPWQGTCGSPGSAWSFFTAEKASLIRKS